MIRLKYGLPLRKIFIRSAILKAGAEEPKAKWFGACLISVVLLNSPCLLAYPQPIFLCDLSMCTLLLKTRKKRNDALFSDGAEHFKTGKRQSPLQPEHIEKFVST